MSAAGAAVVDRSPVHHPVHNMRDDPPSALVDNLLACVSHRWHVAAVLSQLSNSWRSTIAHWRGAQRTVSLTARSLPAEEEWLDAWERPVLDEPMGFALFRDTPHCAAIELLWWRLDATMLKRVAPLTGLKALLLETCSGISDASVQALYPVLGGLEKLSLWAGDGLTDDVLCDGLSRCVALTALTLNLQRYTQLRANDYDSRLRLDASRVVECLAALQSLRSVALYEAEPQPRTAADDDAPPLLALLAERVPLRSFKIAECLLCREADLASFGACSSLVTFDWGGRSSRSAIATFVRGCPRLTDLTLNEQSFPINPQALLEVARHCPLLTQLDVSENRNLDDECVLALCGKHPQVPTGCSALRRLNLSLSDDYEEYDVLTFVSGISFRSLGCLCEDAAVLPSLEWLGVRGRTPLESGEVTIRSNFTWAHQRKLQAARPALVVDC